MNLFNDNNTDNSYDLTTRMFRQSDDYYLFVCSLYILNKLLTFKYILYIIQYRKALSYFLNTFPIVDLTLAWKREFHTLLFFSSIISPHILYFLQSFLTPCTLYFQTQFIYFIYIYISIFLFSRAIKSFPNAINNSYSIRSQYTIHHYNKSTRARSRNMLVPWQRRSERAREEPRR